METRLENNTTNRKLIKEYLDDVKGFLINDGSLITTNKCSNELMDLYLENGVEIPVFKLRNYINSLQVNM